MSSNNTVIPGIQRPAQTMGNAPSFPFSSPTQANATAIPGVSGQPGMPAQTPQGQIFGFLFSVSKTMAGEFWPLMLGANTLGRGASNSIVLNESTVSETHASIHVISRANKLIVYIKDDQSKTGTLLNGELLRGEADLKNGDIVTIGEHYELYVVLINAYDLGLAEKADFSATNPSMFAQPNNAPFMPIPGTPSSAQATVVEGQSGPMPVGGHTIIMGGPAK
jgi:hypothetical protein